VKAGPSSRRVIDFSDIEHASGIIPTGESGNPASPHYRDQAKAYNEGRFRPMMLNRKEIGSVSDRMILRP
jgi:penicillin G amidase